VSVFDLPRLHFAGIAKTHLPTGQRSGLVDLVTNTALTSDGKPFPPDRAPCEYHDHLQRLGPNFDAAGRPAPDGQFSAAKGANYAGSGHFSIDAKILSIELDAGEIDVIDPVVGRYVDMWGHYNDYLQTTFNRARVFDIDPSSNWTTTLMVGQFGFGRAGRSHDTGYLLTGPVRGFQPPRWHNVNHILDVGDHYLAEQLRRSVVHQFVLPEQDELTWFDDVSGSPTVELLRSVVHSGEAGGLVVQFALANMSTPLVPDGPSHWEVRGTIAPWHPTEPRTYPAGRLLVPQGRTSALHNLSVGLTAEHVTLNMITAVPVTTRARHCGPGPTHELGPLLDLGDLELRTVDTGLLVAGVPRHAYLDSDYGLTSGIVRVPRASSSEAADDEALVLVGRDRANAPVTLLWEKEVNLQVDEACQFLEHPRGEDDSDHDVEVAFRSLVRGRPRAVAAVLLRQFFNPRALPLDQTASSPDARSHDVEIVRFCPGRLGDSGDWSSTCMVSTDENGYGWFTLRGARAGSTRVLLAAADDLPCDGDLPGSATAGYDNDDVLGFWSGAGNMSVRVLPDDWRLADISQDAVGFDLVYQEVFAFYELLHSFMKVEVFSLADQCKVETYAKLIWQMCDPRNKSKTYYMPPTRDLSEPKARLLLKFLRAQQQPDEVVTVLPLASRGGRAISSRGELVWALRQAVTIELVVMAQYLYAAYSVPAYGAGLEYVRRGEWTAEQLRISCGAGGETLDEGIRGTLLNVAREEMIHFLMVNNILMAIGEPFHVPRIDFGSINTELPVPLEFSLERLGIGSVQRFILIEQPESRIGEVRRGDRAGQASSSEYTYGSLSELYGDIREGLQRVPNLFLVDRGRGGGEHHLFLRESINQRHPDYQMEVDDLSSALFAIDVVTEQGEGNVLTAETPGEESHFASFVRVDELLRGVAWSPSYPVVRNPTLYEGNATKEFVTDPDARAVMRLFNDSYFVMLQLMVQHFGGAADTSLRRSPLMNGAIDVMTGMMRPLAELLVTMPSGRKGKTAGPSFELDTQPGYLPRPDVAMRAIALRLDQLAKDAGKCPLVSARVAEISAFLANQFRASR
jgi:chromopyrrolic acid synthase